MADFFDSEEDTTAQKPSAVNTFVSPEVNDYSDQYRMLRAFDSESLAAGSVSLEDSWGDYVTYGLAGTVTSAVAGLLNTGIALGEVLGVADKTSYIDESDWVGGIFGNEAQAFYGRHKTGIDITGMVVGSLVPGLAAIKGLRALQRAGKVSDPMRAATGLRNPDLVLDSPAVDAAKNAALNATTAAPNWFSATMTRAYAKGYKQQFAESLAYEAATLATMNQAASLNPNDLGYFEAIGDQFWTATAFAAVGGVFGGTIDAIRISGAVKKHVTTNYARTTELADVTSYISPNFDNLIAGSKILELGRVAATRKEIESGLDVTNTFDRARFAAGTAQYNSMVLKTIGELNDAGHAGIDLLQGLIREATPEQVEVLSTAVSGLERVSTVSARDAKMLQEFTDKTRGPTIIAREDNYEMVAEQITARQEDFADLISRLSPQMGDAGFQFDSQRFKLAIGESKTKNSAGFALSSDEVRLQSSEAFNVRAVNDNGNMLFIPDFMGLNAEKLADTYQMNKFYSKLYNVPLMKEEDFGAYVLFHELGHLKNNTQKAQDYISNFFQLTSKTKDKAQTSDKAAVLLDELKSSKGYKIMSQLVEASLEGREQMWLRKFKNGGIGMNRQQRVDAIMEELTTPGWQRRGMNYLGDPAELLADGAAHITNPATRELASKRFPELAKFFDSQGALAKAWNPTKAYYNQRTKEIVTSFLPGIRDMDAAARVVTTAEGLKLTSAALGKTFTYDTKAFSAEAINAGMTTKLDYEVYDAMWTMADSLKATDVLGSDGFVRIARDNLPLMEKVNSLAISGKNPEIMQALADGKVLLGDYPVSPMSLPELVKQSKEEIRDKLLVSSVGYNEHQRTRILNVNTSVAMGDLSAKNEDWFLYGSKDFSKPEHFTFQYNHKSIADYDGAVMNSVGVSSLDDAVNSQIAATAAELTGKLYEKLPDINPALMSTLNPYASRAGMFNNLRAEMGTLREQVQSTSKLVAQAAENIAHDVDTGFAKFASKFNAPENGGLRYELAQVKNILRREHYYLAASAADGTSYIARKDQVIQAFTQAGQTFDVSMLGQMPEAIIGALKGGTDEFAPNLVKLSEDLGQFYKFQHADHGSVIASQRRTLASTKGFTSTIDPHVLYAPPKNLRDNKYVSFVVPKIFQEGHDARRFMIYAETAGEFEAKRAAILGKYGNDYRVITKQDAEEYQEALGGYANGSVFDEIEFDSKLLNQGRSSELLPNADINYSSSLEEYRTFNIKQREGLMRAGVELRYNGIVQGLKRMDNFYGSVENSVLDKSWREPATIWKDTLDTLLNKRARGSKLEQEWVRVNDFVGSAGSQFIERTLSALRPLKGTTLSQEQLNAFNKSLADNGYKSPFDDVMAVALASPDTLKSNIFPSAVKTLSNLLSTTMLRLDTANSILQTISTPILLLPVLQEAKIALRDTEAGIRLKGATTVLNPETKLYEPSSAKLLANAVKSFWSEEGKVFIQQLKDRNILTDHMSQYLRVTDMSQINGRHSMQAINDSIDKLAKYGSKVSGHNWSEQFSRFLVAHSVRDIAKIRGLPENETWALISGSIDKVHGVYSGAQRPQLFQGVVGQSVGLYQTYFFNMTQNLMKFVASGETKQVKTMAAMQGSLFGLQSFPGFQALNTAIANKNGGEDIYSIMTDNDPDSQANYAMYGLASHMFGSPIDFSTRGSLHTRNTLVIPTRFEDMPIVSTLAKVYANLEQTVENVADSNVPLSSALLHGMAHNGMNRPLQGIAAIVMGDVYTKEGQISWANSNHVGYSVANDYNYGAMFARAIGTKPLNETIVQSTYFRTAEYKANVRKEISDIGGRINFNAAKGELTTQKFGDFALEYERAGGEIQNFNAYWGRQLKVAGTGSMIKFQDEMNKGQGSEMGRAIKRMELKQSTLTPWDTDY